MPKRHGITGFIFAAGLGVRLKPLTAFLPKPILPVHGYPLVLSTLSSMAEAGCKRVVLNLHHLGQEIASLLGSSYNGVPLIYSREAPLRGTFGALYPVLESLADSEYIFLVNGDSICAWPWKEMLDLHIASGVDATLLLHEKAPDSGYGGAIGISNRGRVLAVRDYTSPVREKLRHHLFSGAHIISRKLLKRFDQRLGDIFSNLYIPLLGEGYEIGSLVKTMRWHDVGTADRYLKANLDSEARDLFSAVPPEYYEPSPKAFPKGTTVENSVIFSNATVARECRLRHAVVGPHVRLARGSTVEEQLVTRSETSQDADELVYTPLELA